MLLRDGHEVQVPRDVGLDGASDPVHLAHAIGNQRLLLSHNHDDFEELHDLIVTATGHHPGILIVRFDNDPKRDMALHAIARAVLNLETSGIPLADRFHILNHWR